jgi:uncharacterized phage protein (TIGR02220 family)/predicted phage replisome organizer
MSKYNDTKFYWLQLKEDFFDEDAINWLEEQPNGKEYCLFYLKLCLKSLKTNGIMIRQVGEMLVPYDCKKLSEITNTDVDTVVVAMELLKKIGLIKVLDNGELYLTEVEKMIGSQSIGAFKKQQQRLTSGQPADICPPEIELDIEKESDINKATNHCTNKENVIISQNNIDNQNQTYSLDSAKIKEIVEYLNNKVGTKYTVKAKKTTTHIKARLNEGYTVEDFKMVIDQKYKDWFNTDYAEYLRPETLFGTKFESYLNKAIMNKPKTKVEVKEIQKGLFGY